MKKEKYDEVDEGEYGTKKNIFHQILEVIKRIIETIKEKLVWLAMLPLNVLLSGWSLHGA